MEKQLIKVICINNYNLYLTIGKVYEAIVNYQTYSVINDKGHHMDYQKIKFITLEEQRQNKISEILS